MQAPTDSHFQALQHTLNDVYSTAGQGILLRATDHLSLQAFSDSDGGSYIDTRRFITVYLLLLGKSSICVKSKKQTTVTRSSSEAEYRAMASAASEVT